MIFYYTARSPDGRFTRGSLDATTAHDALAALGNRMLLVSSLDQAGTVRGMLSSALHVGAVSPSGLVALFRSLATLVRAGVALPRCFTVCLEQCKDSRLREALRGVASEVQNGRSLSEAMLTYPREFPALTVAAIRAGEHSGALDDVLGRLASGLERDRSLRKKLLASLTYPGIVVCATIAVAWLLLTTTVPIFENMYAQLRVPIPAILRGLITAGVFLRSPGSLAMFVGGACGAALAMASYARTARGADLVDRFALRLPIIGTVIKKAAVARLARLLGMLLACGISLHGAVPIVAQATGSPRFRASLESLQRSLSEGSSIAAPLEDTGLYDPLFIQLVRVGEETGAIDEMLFRIAEYYDADVEAALQQLGAALEPVITIVLGGVVGGVAAAVFVPLYSLIGSMK